jgi:hypothetical protein
MNSITRKIMSAALSGIGLAAVVGLMGQHPTSLISQADAEGKKWKYYGASTCGGGSCHAAAKPDPKRPANEYSTWQKKDRHAKAFNTLFEEASQEMCEELEIEDASKDTRCTVCHSTNVPKALRGDKYNAEDGVSCDGCHGPASGWFKPHTKPHKYEEMLKLGMWDTRNMWRRADMCVSCHLQIEPELVDAGHPDLSFELYAHSTREPPHWFERQSWDGVRSWAVGQAVALREALAKIKKRIPAKKGKEGDDLEAATDAVDGAVLQAQSYVVIFRHAVNAMGDAGDKKVLAELNALFAAEELDDAKLTAACGSGATLMDKLGKKFAGMADFDAAKVKALYAKIASDPLLGDTDEFTAEQAAGALYALYNSAKQGKGPRNKGAVETPKEIAAILVRPTVYEPEDLFDGEGTFKGGEWARRLKVAAGLVK